MIEGCFLGYDLRLKPDTYLALTWTEDRRESYLIRPDIYWPLSIDTDVWPSIFKYIGFPGVYTFIESNSEPQFEQIEVEALDVQQYRLGLWPSLLDMNRSAREQNLLDKTISIAVFLVGDESRIKEDQFWSEVLVHKEKLPDDFLPKDYQFVGYDIADEEFTSALSNCGYEIEEKEDLPKQWGACLNEYGLFLNFEDASRFAIFCDERVHEHAPFFVFSLFAKGRNSKARGHP